MNKLLKYTLLSLVFLITAKNSFAFQFEKSPQNPLPITYSNGYAYHQQVHVFKENNLYKGIFVIIKPSDTYHSLGYFESQDGISWEMKKEILNTGLDLSNPRILKISNGYILFITRYDVDHIYRLYSSSCDNDFNCSSNFTPVIIPNQSNSSENNGVFAGFPYIQNNQTYLFFGAWGSSGFQMKLAYSTDLISWQRCPNDKTILRGDDGPFAFEQNGNLYLFFHHSDSSGIGLARTTLPLSCDSDFEDLGYLLVKDKDYDRNHMVFSSIVEDHYMRLYYSGLGNDGSWHLSLANQTDAVPIPTSTIEPTPSSTPIPTATIIPTLIPTVQPTPMTLKPIIIVPGILASWNKEAIVHNVSQPQSSWVMNPLVTEYSGLIKTLKNLGYVENNNLFIFNYDWRKPIQSSADDLNLFITQKIGNNNFQIIGHSLGGLIGRIYYQKYNNGNLSKLITVGSPNSGVTQMYKIVEAGEIDSFNDYVSLAAKIILAINKNNFETDKITIGKMFPVFKDLFPTYNFLKKNNQEIPIKNLEIQNIFLTGYNSNLSNWSNKSNMANIVGVTGTNTIKGFNVEQQTLIDRLLDNYPDGRPQSPYYDQGDGTVLISSATINSPEVLNLGHNELIYKKSAIKKILDILNINYQESQLTEGLGTNINSSLLFLIKSPALMSVTYKGTTYPEQDGQIYIENAQNGDYQLKVNGTGNGSYEVIIGQLGKDSDVWDHLYGQITKNPPGSQTDIYDIQYDHNSPKSYFETSNNIIELFNDLINYLNISNKNSSTVKKLTGIRNSYPKNKNNEKLKINLSFIKNEIIKNLDFVALEKIENIQIKLNNKNHFQFISTKVKELEKRINNLNKPINRNVLTEIMKRFDSMKNRRDSKNEIYEESIEELLKVVHK